MSKTFRMATIVTAKVTGVQNYGVFLELDEDTQGLIHILNVNMDIWICA